MDFQHIFESFKQFSLSLSLVMCYPLFFLLLLATSLLSTSGADSHDKYNSSCPEHVCGGVSIKYPFWLQDDAGSNRHCGYRNFGLNCSADNQAIFQILEEAYHVKEIDYGNFTLTLVDDDAKTNTTCPRARQNLTLHNVPHLQYTNSDTNLSFYYNCSSAPEGEPSIRCLRFGAMRSFVFLEGGELAGFDWLGSCEEKVVVTVMEREIRRDDLVAGFSGAMIEGFVIKWNHVEECGTCEASDGLCGYDEADQNSNEFLCFCPGGAVNARQCKGNGLHWRLKVALGFVSGAVGLSISIIYCCIKSKASFLNTMIRVCTKKSAGEKDMEAFISNYGSLFPKRFGYSDVKKMTCSFRDKLGHGGYGNVYKGKLPDGRLVAVKVLKQSKGDGEEFINEVASISRTSHVNVVTLLGFCFEGRKRALIYEFMCKGSLEKYVCSKKGTIQDEGHLEWEKLYQISIGIARGLEYLHRGCNTRILHFDIKPHNILLDEDFCPKISDFGLAKLCNRKESIVSMLEARGTIGYIAPEVFSRNFGGVSHKSDVYSYGMMVMEMVGAKNNIDVVASNNSSSSDVYFPQWIYKRLEQDEDVLFHGEMTKEETEMVRKMALVGLWCIQTDPSRRPSMSEVIDMLEGRVEALMIPPKPFISSPPRTIQCSSSTLA